MYLLFIQSLFIIDMNCFIITYCVLRGRLAYNASYYQVFLSLFAFSSRFCFGAEIFYAKSIDIYMHRLP